MGFYLAFFITTIYLLTSFDEYIHGISIKSPGVGWESVDGTAESRTEGRQSREPIMSTCIMYGASEVAGAPSGV